MADDARLSPLLLFKGKTGKNSPDKLRKFEQAIQKRISFYSKKMHGIVKLL